MRPTALVLCALGLALAVPAAAQGPQEPPAGGRPLPADEGRAPVELDKLLKLPRSLDYSVQTRGGRTPGEWRARFREIRDALEAEKEALRSAEARLEDQASQASAYQFAPPIPGAGPSTDAPLDFQLRQEINRRREEIELLERALQELEIEANLAGVPEGWRD